MGFLRGPKLGKRRNSILRKSFRWRSLESCLSTRGDESQSEEQELRNKRRTLELSVRIKPKEGSFCEGDIEIKRNLGKAQSFWERIELSTRERIKLRKARDRQRATSAIHRKCETLKLQQNSAGSEKISARAVRRDIARGFTKRINPNSCRVVA